MKRWCMPSDQVVQVVAHDSEKLTLLTKHGRIYRIHWDQDEGWKGYQVQFLVPDDDPTC